MDYDIDIEKVVAEVEKLGKKEPKVCLQLPDGLKMHGDEIVDELHNLLSKKGISAKIWLWASSNWGACDYPWYLKDHGFDLLVNFGHVVFRKRFVKGQI
ncbi:MAG TPA: diphthamide synthesis protein [Candidatus Nanoarchaeia archaeon]|nr:diphthamide synthesis protein [Candidatus Nanoarchaeia archaeon]